MPETPGEWLLRVEAPHFVAGAIFRRTPARGWTCVRAAPILDWMTGKALISVKPYLDRKGWGQTWSPPPGGTGGV
jgi:hypothetical protein